MALNIVEAEKNITIPYTQGVRPYHTVLARLVRKYAGPSHRRLFDLGCGVGNTLVEIAREVPALDIVIADPDPTCLRLTSEKVQVAKSIHLEDFEEIFAMQDTFDIIILSHTLQYDPQPYRTMQKLLDMLRPGGYLLMASPNPSTPTKILHNVVRKYYSEGIYTWDRSVLRNFLQSFEDVRIVEVTQDYVPLPILHKHRATMPLLTSLSRVFPWLAFSVIMVVEKQ